MFAIAPWKIREMGIYKAYPYIMKHLRGITLIDKTDLQDRGTIDISPLENGLYIVDLEADNTNYKIKLVKEWKCITLMLSFCQTSCQLIDY